MRVKFPRKVESFLVALRRRLLPRSLFFRTMLLIFIPLIVVQVVSIYAFLDGNWTKVGKKLSDNLTANMAFVMKMHDENPDFSRVQEMASSIYGLDVSYYDNESKHSVWRKNKKENPLVTGFLNESLHQQFPMANTEIFWASIAPALIFW